MTAFNRARTKLNTRYAKLHFQAALKDNHNQNQTRKAAGTEARAIGVHSNHKRVICHSWHRSCHYISWDTACLDHVGRRVARLAGMDVTAIQTCSIERYRNRRRVSKPLSERR